MTTPNPSNSNTPAAPPATQPEPAALQSRAEALETKVRELESALADARAARDADSRRHTLESALREAGAIDVETALIMAERAMSESNGAPADNAPQTTPPDPHSVIAALKDRKPFLFRTASASAQPGASVMSAGIEPAPLATAEAAATDAARHGDRRSVLRYLRAKRGC